MEASITLKRVGKLSGRDTILAGLTFGIEKGTLTAIVGDNNAGKSTLLKVLAGFENPEHGSIFIHGLDSVKRRAEVRKMVGYVPLVNDMDPWLTLEQNIRFTGLLYGLDEALITQRIIHYAQRLHLSEDLTRMVRDLSNGIVKEGMLIRGLIHDPQVLIIDEPTTFMDAESSRLAWELLNHIRHQTTIVYASQNLTEVEQEHDRILVMRHGKVLLDGPLDKLLESTLDYHQFEIEFDEFSDEMYKKLTAVPSVVSPSRNGPWFHFYGRSRRVFFQVIQAAGEQKMIDVKIKKLGLRDLLDSEFAREGLE